MVTRKLIYTFFSYTKHCSRLLYKTEIPGWDKKFLPRDNATKSLIDTVKDYDLIIGIADHNKNATQNRFDPVYINKWGTRMIIPDAPDSYASNLKILPTEDLYIFSSHTNGPCNRSAFLIMNEIQIKNYPTKAGFFHFKKSLISDELLELLKEVEQINL